VAKRYVVKNQQWCRRTKRQQVLRSCQ